MASADSYSLTSFERTTATRKRRRDGQGKTVSAVWRMLTIFWRLSSLASVSAKDAGMQTVSRMKVGPLSLPQTKQLDENGR